MFCQAHDCCNLDKLLKKTHKVFTSMFSRKLVAFLVVGELLDCQRHDSEVVDLRLFDYQYGYLLLLVGCGEVELNETESIDPRDPQSSEDDFPVEGAEVGRCIGLAGLDSSRTRPTL
ncbi:unnamed protein product [Strongylus vulgaris]|uniref:Uncharacterized protein n=1 Tax=Strongylus vulgaris TaxID=40348 RepID=A0A3P7INR4_STRVU|nr:unnamed protein product [Strongylus vulgaris]